MSEVDSSMKSPQLVMASLFPDEEIWASIPGFPNYMMSSLGRCASFRRMAGPGVNRCDLWITCDMPQRVMRPVYSDRENRQSLKLRRTSGTKKSQVGRWVLLAFIGPRPLGMCCCHRDGNPLNNRLENLRWGTSSSNAFDMVLHRTQRSIKLTPDQVQAIRQRLAEGAVIKELGCEYGVSASSISRIKSGHRWSQLEPA